MINLDKIIADSLKNIANEGYVEKVVESHLKKTIEEIVSDVLGRWSTLSKNLKAEIESQLNVNFSELDIPTYNTLVLNAIKEKLDEAIHIQGVEKIKKSMDEILGDVNKEYKLSELVEKMKYDDFNNSNCTENECTFIYPSDRDILHFIYMDPEEGKEKYECKYKLTLNKDGTVNSIDLKGRNFKKDIITGGLYGFDALLFKLYAHGSKVILDENDVDTEYEERDGEY